MNCLKAHCWKKVVKVSNKILKDPALFYPVFWLWFMKSHKQCFGLLTNKLDSFLSRMAGPSSPLFYLSLLLLLSYDSRNTDTALTILHCFFQPYFPHPTPISGRKWDFLLAAGEPSNWDEEEDVLYSLLYLYLLKLYKIYYVLWQQILNACVKINKVDIISALRRKLKYSSIV